MQNNYHLFHIPVMGTGFSIDTPIKVAPFGISSVISIIDDILVEKVRKFYARKYNFSFKEIAHNEFDSRAKRITEYLNLVQKIVNIKIEEIKNQPFFQQNNKSKYFEMLPESSPLKHAYNRLFHIVEGPQKDFLAAELNDSILPGSIDVNIMSKIDQINLTTRKEMTGDEFSEAKAALRGFAKSNLSSSVVFSAGINRGLFTSISQFSDFYRDHTGQLKKKITLKVSDFRSALIQGKFLAAKGLEVSEFRIESGLNCGGHSFVSNGLLLPFLLREFKEKKAQLTEELKPVIQRYYETMGREFPLSALTEEPLITVQGGIGTSGEAQRMIEDFGCDSTGWGSPFLLVHEATNVDRDTLELLMNATKDDLYLSNSSPLGVPFNNLRNTGSEHWTKTKSLTPKPGSPCPKGCLVSNTEFSDTPICTASTLYQTQKISEINNWDTSEENKRKFINAVHEKICLCEHLGNGTLISLGIDKKKVSPQAICPGPNIVWFNREYSLREMIDHIYGRGLSLVPEERPHMFCQEIELYVNYIDRLFDTIELDEKGISYLKKFRENLETGMDYCLEIGLKEAYPHENLASIPSFISEQKLKLNRIFAENNLI
ncbi:MAG TPA: hypothetical protein PLT92_10005 [Ignavibacteriaceae bacterium]|nr:hypothetical protein [Ignavibacteriaceae bacterium]